MNYVESLEWLADLILYLAQREREGYDPEVEKEVRGELTKFKTMVKNWHGERAWDKNFWDKAFSEGSLYQIAQFILAANDGTHSAKLPPIIEKRMGGVETKPYTIESHLFYFEDDVDFGSLRFAHHNKFAFDPDGKTVETLYASGKLVLNALNTAKKNFNAGSPNLLLLDEDPAQGNVYARFKDGTHCLIPAIPRGQHPWSCSCGDFPRNCSHVVQTIMEYTKRKTPSLNIIYVK